MSADEDTFFISAKLHKISLNGIVKYRCNYDFMYNLFPKFHQIRPTEIFFHFPVNAQA